jgi:hypothetical protein
VPRNTRLSRFHYLHFFEWKVEALAQMLLCAAGPTRSGSVAVKNSRRSRAAFAPASRRMRQASTIRGTSGRLSHEVREELADRILTPRACKPHCIQHVIAFLMDPRPATLARPSAHPLPGHQLRAPAQRSQGHRIPSELSLLRRSKSLTQPPLRVAAPRGWGEKSPCPLESAPPRILRTPPSFARELVVEG